MASRKLSRYRAKRDFSKTAEPSGARRIARADGLRFVIQKHAAGRLHYDLRLELDGVFKSWAVTRGPSLDPADKRLAVEVEDHPLDYGDFEGTIPKGQYGGGTVQLWDRGYWRAEEGESPAEALKAGTLKFVLEGERLHGSWVLVRMKNDRFGSGKRTNWLLIKHDDEYARRGDHDALLAEDRSVASGRAMAMIEAGKGRAPKGFMVRGGKGKATPDAVWQSNRSNEGAGPGSDGEKPASDSEDPASEGAEPAETSTERARTALGPTAHKSTAGKSMARGKRIRSLPEFVSPQLARLVDRPPAQAGWGHEIKLDGYRLQLRVHAGHSELRTRKGLDWTRKFPELKRAAEDLPDGILDGEVVAVNERGVPDFAALQGALSEGETDKLVFFAFDLLFLDHEDLRPLALTERKARLQDLLGARPKSVTTRIRYLEHFETAGDAVLKSACQIDLEGIVSKRLDAPYRSDRSGSWVKSKCRAGHEVVIGGWSSDAGALRSLIVGVYRDGQLVPVGRVGTGFGREKVGPLMKRLKRVATRTSPFAGKVAVPGGRRINWVRPELVAEIEFAGWTEGGNVRQAAFKGLREDKPAKEVRAEKPTLATLDEPSLASPARRGMAAKAGPERRATPRPGTMAKAKAPARGRASRAPARSSAKKISDSSPDVVLGVRISKPHKPLWPADGGEDAVTKLDLARYFASAGEWMLPHLTGRPCSIIRAPDGIDGQRFFQRHAMPGMSNLVALIKVAGDRQPYVQISRVEALVAIAQTAGLELHPGGCVPGDPEIPGRLVFDLDPAPDVHFKAVIRAAIELRQRLADLGLESFCKTTGGKGLHVVTPLLQPARPDLGWPVAKAFAQAVCRTMADDAPESYVLNMAKKERTGRIFLDYLRNDRLSTAVAPLSPRARPGAPVSMPLTWPQVRAGLDPLRFTVRTAMSALRQSKAWGDYDEGARPLVSAIQKLTGSKNVARGGKGPLQPARRPGTRSAVAH